MSAAGGYLPPFFIFSRKRMVPSLMNKVLPQSVGCGNPSGWTDSELFVKCLQHSVACTNSSKDPPHIIVLDGYHSHKTYAHEHGIHLITLPPHSTHKIQPLDRLL